MTKRIIALLTVIPFILTLFSTSLVFAEKEKYTDPVIKVESDTYIRCGQDSVNFEQFERIVVDSTSPGNGNNRISFLDFSLDGYEEYLNSATRVLLKFVMWSDAGDETSGNKLCVIPLEDGYKNIDLKTITYNSATQIRSGDVRLIDYMPSSAQVYPVTKYGEIIVDVTDYCKSIADNRAVFMIKSVSGAYSIESKETTNVGAEPSLTIESGYTGVLNHAVEIADSFKKKYDGMSISDNVDFETECDGYSVRFVSDNEAFITDDGEVLSRPDLNEDNVQVHFTVEVTHPEFGSLLESADFNITILKNGYSAVNSVDINTDKITFDFEDISTVNDRHVLCIDTNYLNDKREYSLYSEVLSEGNFIKNFTADCTKTFEMFDVTDYISGSAATFIFSGETKKPTQNCTSIMLDLSETQADAIIKLHETNLGDLRYVTSDLVLPSAVNEYSLTWFSSNKEVLSDNGRVIRGNCDTVSTLTSVLSGNDMIFKMTYYVNVIRENTDVENGLYSELKDPMHISDEEFFGKWDPDEGIWVIEPILQYKRFEGISEVETLAKNGNYTAAKRVLLSYYRLKQDNEIYTFKPNTSYDIKAAAMVDKIWTYSDNDRLLGEAYVGTDWGWYSIDLTGSVGNQNGTYWIMESDMDGTGIEIASKEHESGNLAFVEIIANGQKKRYPVQADTYISAGNNSSINYGAETVLVSRESAGDDTIPFGENTARTYLRFGFEQDNVSTISSVKLNFYGRATGSAPKKVYCLSTQNSRKFIENEFAWEDQYPQAFCFKETGFVWRTINQYNTEWKTEVEWINYSSRLYQTQWLLTRYLVTGNEQYAYRALEIAMSQYTQQPGALFPRNLEGGWRSENLIRTMYTAINSEHMTPEIFTALLKWVYDHGYNLKDQTAATTNWNSAFKVNFARICAFFPEIAKAGWWEKALDSLYKFYSGTLLNEDGSYTESCTNYITGVIEEIIGALEIVGAREGKDNEYYIYFKKQLAELVTYYTNLRYSSGKMVPWGDGGRGGNYDATIGYNEYAEDEIVRWITTGSSEGTMPDYTTRLYPSKGMVMFKSDWHEDGLCAFFNNDAGGTHGHRDDLALDVSAYNDYLLVDAGVSSYSEGSIFSDKRHDTINHNTIQVDNKNQEHATYNNAGSVELKTNGTFDYLKSASDNKMYLGINVKRNVLFMKNKFIIVSDSMIPYDDNPHTYRQLWHPDYNFNMELDPETNVAKTNFSSRPNIKIVPADTGEEAKLFNRMMMSGIETESRSVQYYKEDVTGNQTFDTVLYPEKIASDTDIKVTRILLDNVPLEDATSFMININDNTGYFYSSNEEIYPERCFGDYSYDGEMVYVETDSEDKTTFIAITKGSKLKLSEQTVLESAEELYDFSAKFESGSLKLYSANKLPDSGIKIVSPKKYQAVYFNDEKVEFEYSDGYITTKGESKKSESTEGALKPGSPVSGNKPGSDTGVGGTTGTGTVIPPETAKPDETESYYPFADSENHWAKDYISVLYNKGVVSGISKTEFAPDRAITRAEFTKILVSACGGINIPSTDVAFIDCISDAWYAEYVNAAYSLGIVSGYDDGTFRPDGFITREEMAKMLCIVSDILGNHYGSNVDISFTDNGMISDWAYLYVKKACVIGLFNGDTENKFNPKNNATRAETAAVVCRLLGV